MATRNEPSKEEKKRVSKYKSLTTENFLICTETGYLSIIDNCER